MKTTKLEKSIEVSKRRIADYEKKAAMYAERFAKCNEFGFSLLSVDERPGDWKSRTENNEALFKTWKQKYIEKYGENEFFHKYYKLTENAESYVRNKIDFAREKANLEHLESELANIHSTIQAKEDNQKQLKTVIQEVMAEFEDDWFDRMMTWHEKHYAHIQEQKPIVRAWIDKEKRIYYDYHRQFRFHHKKLQERLEEKENRLRRTILCDKAAYTTYKEYMEWVDRELHITWENAVQKLTDKCQDYDIDLQKIEAHNPSVSSEGFNVVITDGKPRTIHARMIWAAECSIYKQPHTRYIVTEKKIKGGAK